MQFNRAQYKCQLFKYKVYLAESFHIFLCVFFYFCNAYGETNFHVQAVQTAIRIGKYIDKLHLHCSFLRVDNMVFIAQQIGEHLLIRWNIQLSRPMICFDFYLLHLFSIEFVYRYQSFTVVQPYWLTLINLVHLIWYCIVFFS